jgi:hypothetical protein
MKKVENFYVRRKWVRQSGRTRLRNYDNRRQNSVRYAPSALGGNLLVSFAVREVYFALHMPPKRLLRSIASLPVVTLTV